MLSQGALLVALTIFMSSGRSRAWYRAPVPPLGLNTWYALGKEASFERTKEENILAVADYLASSGLKDLGFKFLVIDDGWSSGLRGKGGLDANASKFPSGMAKVAAHVRRLGLALGLYTTPGQYTCAGESGGGERASGGHEAEDVRKWIKEWGVSWIKDCVCNSTQQERMHAYHEVRAEIDAIQSDAILECANYMDAPWRRDPLTGRIGALDCDVYTVSDDVPDDFEAWNLIVDLAEAEGARFIEGVENINTSWPSFDYVRAGGAQSAAQYRAQVGFLAIAPAPLMIGSVLNLSNPKAMLEPSTLAMFSNQAVLAIQQDELGMRAQRVSHAATGHNGAFMDVYVRLLSQSRIAVLLLNRSSKEETFSLDLLEATSGLLDILIGHYIVTDAWTGEEIKLIEPRLTRTVEATGAALLVLEPSDVPALALV